MFTLSADQIKAIASMHAATPQSASERMSTPVLAAIRVDVTGATLTAVATDRYMAGMLELTLEPEHVTPATAEGISLQLDSKEWQALAKRVQPHCALTFAIDDDGIVTAKDAVTGLTVAAAPQVSGNFPPVARLFPSEPGPLNTAPAFGPDKLTRAFKMHTPGHDTAKARRDLAWKFETDSSHGGAKIAPALLTPNSNTDAARLSVLVQPMIFTR